MPTRLELGPTDLVRVRVAPSLGPLAETALAYSSLQHRAAALPVAGPGRAVRERATTADRALASYLWLSPSAGFDLFTLAGPSTTVAAGRESVLDASGDVWRAEVDSWAGLRAEARRRRVLAPPTPGNAEVERALAGADVDAWRRLLEQVQGRFETWIGPSWPVLRDQLVAEEARLAHQVATGGVQALFASLGHGIRWTGTTLDLAGTGITGKHVSVIRLGGRGLSVVPSLFALEPMVYLPADASAPALLLVPCAPSPVPVAGRPAGGGAELLGRTRAAVLRQVARGPRTTSQLSQELGIALSGASQHAAVLRRAGLITTARVGGHVQHSITGLGEELLAHL